ncbi:MAG: hypothetical protein KAS38_10320, partial [Anaerolineales bacterium]|nr:hypothetical protein [Anaerolineales bacterium]
LTGLTPIQDFACQDTPFQDVPLQDQVAGSPGLNRVDSIRVLTGYLKSPICGDYCFNDDYILW